MQFCSLLPQRSDGALLLFYKDRTVKGKRGNVVLRITHTHTEELILPIRVLFHNSSLEKEGECLSHYSQGLYHQVLLVKISFSVLLSFLLVFLSMTEERVVCKSLISFHWIELASTLFKHYCLNLKVAASFQRSCT